MDFFIYILMEYFIIDNKEIRSYLKKIETYNDSIYVRNNTILLEFEFFDRESCKKFLDKYRNYSYNEVIFIRHDTKYVFYDLRVGNVNLEQHMEYAYGISPTSITVDATAMSVYIDDKYDKKLIRKKKLNRILNH